MMNEFVQQECGQNAMPDFEVMKKFMEDDSKGRNCKRERIKNREIRSRQDERGPGLRKRTVRRPASHRWSRLMNHDDTYRMPSLFTWRY